MSDFRDNILGRAFQVVPGGEFNRARRELLERADIAPVVYEVSLPERGSWESFRDATFPPLVRYL
ncbi:MAG: STAUR_1299 family protein, partial [Candidatus Angelobacter sp.]